MSTYESGNSHNELKDALERETESRARQRESFQRRFGQATGENVYQARRRPDDERKARRT